MTDPQPLAALLPALLCPAVEDVTGFPCRRLACDGVHSVSGVDPWVSTPVAVPALPAPVCPGARGATTTDPEETDMSETWPTGVDAARWLRGACSSGDPLRSAVVAVCDEVERLRADVQLWKERANREPAGVCVCDAGPIHDGPFGPLPHREWCRADEQPEAAPRVWLPGDTVPAGTWVTDRHGDEDPPFWLDRDTVIAEFGDALAVAVERARRALSAAAPPAAAGSGNGASEAREAGSVAAGAAHAPAEGGGSER